MNRIRPKQPRLRLDPEPYDQLRNQVLRRDGWRCQLCGSRQNLDVHHQQLRSQEGDDADPNLITLCAECHSLLPSPGGITRVRFAKAILGNRSRNPMNVRNSTKQGRMPRRPLLRHLKVFRCDCPSTLDAQAAKFVQKMAAVILAPCARIRSILASAQGWSIFGNGRWQGGAVP